MKIIHDLFWSFSAGGLFYLIGVLSIHPYSPVVKILEKRSVSYDKILKNGHLLCLISWVIASAFIFCNNA